MSTHPLADPDYDGEWYPYEGGVTVGLIGSENGYVLRDDELGDPDDPEAADARLTLEQGRVEKPGYFYSASLYGWMFHVHGQDAAIGDTRALQIYDEMKAQLLNMAQLLPYEEDGQKRIEAKAAALTQVIAAFEQTYGAALPESAR